MELNGVEGSLKDAEMPADLRVLFESYEDIFQPLTQLPTQIEHDHSITLKEGTDPINVRPYRYPHSQKNEIERLVQDMLKAGIIQSSISPFSSPVILVKKKDGYWRFYVDYRALNTLPFNTPFP